MNNKELIELAMKQQTSSDKMMECNHSKELAWSKIYLLGFEMGKQKSIDSTMEAYDLVMKYKRLKPEQKAIVKARLAEMLEAQKKREQI